ncbi:hypothetical protein HTZ97_08195 [Desulfuromonas acetoxidans]|uniref:ResB-like domain-containing protein n=1 Tax=Desulfuromonas acetoxidans (strain DSM 684 / 11070) TaxID=281689 RepID=Q1K0D3_DESA6|nr:hypothetical protein [Desulfuromonas acetoxidans]EAT16008.1 conserved hypothetical protein [Desulfuromonas acetoxidans DSM 684]MBF0644094.1 hypothetical protein [Desulfuromonas acetoxidans]NVD24607.1 hypothetical protein [Desulfuromonas acetoxidans]NVE16443.1 hypothetical protein [Desulfuromonas acetoxidans]
MITMLWQRLASTKLCFWTLNLLCLNLFIGGLYAMFDGRYRQLNMTLFPQWIHDNFDTQCWWLITLMLVLALLGANTFACSVQRLQQLWQRRRANSWRTNLVLLSPTLMHLCFLLILSGHALTEFSGLKENLPISTGQQLHLDNTAIEVLSQSNTLYGDGPLNGVLRQSQAQLRFTRNGQQHETTLRVLHPVYDNGASYHLLLAKKPRPGQPPTLKIAIKKDPGLPLILLGNALMSLLMAIYFVTIRHHRYGGQS